MPLYTHICQSCCRRTSLFKTVAERDALRNCEICDGPLIRVLDAPRVQSDYEGYSCPITGRWIEGRRAHEENLKQHGCRLLEPGESREAQRRLAQDSEALENRVAESAAAYAANLPVHKQEKLATELANGFDVSFERTSI